MRNEGGQFVGEGEVVVFTSGRLAAEALWLDADGDGDADLIIPMATTDSALVVQSSSGKLVGVAHRAQLATTTLQTSADLDGDGFADAGRAQGAGHVEEVDFDADGDADVIVISPDRTLVMLLRRDGDVLVPVDGGSKRLDRPGAIFRWQDTDGDGDLDLVIHGMSSSDAKALSSGPIEEVPEPPGELPQPLADPPFDHGSDLTSGSLLDDDHPQYLLTESDDTFSDSQWIIKADTGATDNKLVSIAGGGGAAASDGGYITVSGNDYSPSGGSVSLNTGDASNAFVSLNAFGDSGSFARMTHNDDGSTPEEVAQIDATGFSITSTRDNPVYFGEDVWLKFEGLTDDANELTVDAADPTADRTITFPNSSGTVAVSGTAPIELSSSGAISCPTCSVGHTKSLELTHCSYDSTLATNRRAEPNLFSKTSVGSGTETVSSGFDFQWDSSGDDDNEEMFCEFIVPADYTGSGTAPQLTMVGWNTSCSICGLNCASSVNVELEVSAREYASGDRANESWGTADTALFTWASESCSGTCSPNCWQAARVAIASADATPSASDWTAGRLVFVRILRDAGASNEAPFTFHLSAIQLAYE